MTSAPKIVVQNTSLFLDDDLIILIPWAIVTSTPPLRRTPHIPLLLFQVVQQNVRKWQAPGRGADQYGQATIREA